MQTTICDKCGVDLGTWHTVEMMGFDRHFCQKCIIPVIEFMIGYCDPKEKPCVGFQSRCKETS